MTPVGTFEEVYQAWVQYVWRTLQRLGVRSADLADVAQEVFLIVHQRLSTFERREATATMAPWLFRICFNVARNYQRRAHTRQEVMDEGQVNSFVDASADAASFAVQRQERAMLQVLLDALPLEQRAVFVLFELEETPADEIAEACEIPLATVYSRLRLARAAFRQALTRAQARERPPVASAGGSR